MQDAKKIAHVRIELQGLTLRKVEDWRRLQPKIPSRNEAVRLLLAQALEVSEQAA
jgi:hypothetical protein